MLGAGCLTGAIGGVYGQFVIDDYLEHVTDFPVARIAAVARPVEILVLVVAFVLVLMSLPGWFAARAPVALALNE